MQFLHIIYAYRYTQLWYMLALNWNNTYMWVVLVWWMAWANCWANPSSADASSLWASSVTFWLNNRLRLFTVWGRGVGRGSSGSTVTEVYKQQLITMSSQIYNKHKNRLYRQYNSKQHSSKLLSTVKLHNTSARVCAYAKLTVTQACDTRQSGDWNTRYFTVHGSAGWSLYMSDLVKKR
jgi:hypothetical protein